MVRRRPTRGALLLALAIPLLTGCAAAGQSWRAGPAGIPVERELRAQLTAGEFEAAYASLRNKKVAPADLLLRHMYRGVAALHAGDHEAGARHLDRAWEISWERWTKRLGDGAMAMVTGDGALPYEPGPAEMMFIPYYGALTWLARNERHSAAVEARRLSRLLESEQGAQPGDAFRGVMRYVAGAMYEVAGERNDADVSYRNAARLLGGAPLDTIPPDAGHGDVVVIVEDGFVIRPEPRSLVFWFSDGELSALSGDSPDERHRTVQELRRRQRLQHDWAAMGFHAATLHWPAMEPEHHVAEHAPVGARALVGVPSATPVAFADAGRSATMALGIPSSQAMITAQAVSASVSDAIRADFERDQPARLARAIARVALRDAALRGAGKAFERAVDDDDDEGDDEKGKGAKKAGNILLGVGLLFAGASSAVLDQPDLRAWQLLPDRLTVTRMRLPVGEHPIEITRGGEAVSLGTVSVRPGSVTLLTHRFFPGRPVALAASP
jgi:hypothetical protein